MPPAIKRSLSFFNPPVRAPACAAKPRPVRPVRDGRSGFCL